MEIIMDIKLGMPELLLIFSLVVYSQSFTFSVIAFCLGVSARIVGYVMNYSIQMKKAETLEQNVEDLGKAFTDIFSVKNEN